MEIHQTQSGDYDVACGVHVPIPYNVTVWANLKPVLVTTLAAGAGIW